MREKIKSLLELSGGKAFKIILSPTQYDYFPGYIKLNDEDKARFDMFYKDLSWELLLNYIEPIYAKYYTSEDIDNLLNFYTSSTGQKMLNISVQLMPEISQGTEQYITYINNIVENNEWQDILNNWKNNKQIHINNGK